MRKAEHLRFDYFLLACLLAPVAAWSAESDDSARPRFTAQLYAGLDQTNNAGQRRDGDSATMARAGLFADLTRRGRLLEFGMRGDLSWLDYSGSDVASGTDGSMTAYANLGTEGGWFVWSIRDTLRQSRRDVLGNDSPDNREYVNAFSTGPTLLVPLGDRSQLVLTGVYSRDSYEESPLDSETLEGDASLRRRIGEYSTLSMHATTARTRYESAVLESADFNVREYFLRYDTSARRSSSVQIDIGYAGARTQGVTDNSPLVRLGLQRRLSDTKTVFLTAKQQYVPSSRTELEPVPGAEAELPLSAPGAMRMRAADFGWTAQGLRTLVRVTGGVGEEHYESVDQFDRSYARMQLWASRQLSSTLSTQLSAMYRIEDVQDSAQPEAHFRAVGLGLTSLLGRRLSAAITVDWSSRRASGTPYDFTEWLYGFRFTYLLTSPGR